MINDFSLPKKEREVFQVFTFVPIFLSHLQGANVLRLVFHVLFLSDLKCLFLQQGRFLYSRPKICIYDTGDGNIRVKPMGC